MRIDIGTIRSTFFIFSNVSALYLTFLLNIGKCFAVSQTRFYKLGDFELERSVLMRPNVLFNEECIFVDLDIASLMRVLTERQT